MPHPLRIAVLASGGGSNCQALIDRINDGTIPDTEIRCVVSNNSSSGVMERAHRHGVETVHLSNKHAADDLELDRLFITCLQERSINLVILAGYMKKRGPLFVNAFTRRIINIHPSLLPRYGGRGMYGERVHRAVLDAGEAESGATVHLVNEEYDRGVILAQEKVPVKSRDTVQSLADRVLRVEHRILPRTTARIAAGEIDLDSLP